MLARCVLTLPNTCDAPHSLNATSDSLIRNVKNEKKIKLITTSVAGDNGIFSSEICASIGLANASFGSSLTH